MSHLYLSKNTVTKPMTNVHDNARVVLGFVLEQVSLKRLLIILSAINPTPGFMAPSMRGMSGFNYI